MKVTSDTLTVTFDSSLADKAGLCVLRSVNDKNIVVKIESGEQAAILYRLLTEQKTKGELISKGMTREEAKNFLIDISYKLGNMAIEYLTEKDGEKMREAIKVLEQAESEEV